ncbi:carbon catabolite repressor protein 4 homolog 1-like [Silene latifolia]|uniref:carbon catabolite repressor protein 4 homolog 1-like n=1 Tax=Silene latifolia TaxID=37657 RepID=UPI003D789726
MNLEQEICCEIIPIPNSSPSDLPKHALFFHRFHERGTEFSPGNDTSCSHDNDVGTVQSISCVENGSLEKQMYHRSHKCSDDTTNHSFEWVSWFDERIEVVIPRCRKWNSRMSSANIFVPLLDNVGFSFKLGPASGHHSQDAFYAKDVTVTEPSIQRLHLRRRRLIPLTKEISEPGNFKVLSYNILSDIYLYPEKYFYCPQWALNWEYRRENLLHEIMQYDADIVCLQEVQSDHFENFFKPELAKYGYLAAYKKKTKEVYTGNGYTIDGCAIFYRGDIFKEVVSYELEFSKTALSLIGKLERSQRDQAGVRLIKDNIALVVILEMVGHATSHAPSWSRLCVVNTHIFASKGSPDVKLLQVSDLLNEIEKTAMIDPKMPLFICGDINSLPGSDPYILLAKGEVTPVSGEDAIDLIKPHLKLRHSMNLASAYTTVVKPIKHSKRQSKNKRNCSIGEPCAYTEAVKPIKNFRRQNNKRDGSTGEPSVTSLTSRWQRTLDYIFYTVDSLEVTGLLELPDLDSVGRILPSPLWPSDHIALMAMFKITRPFIR